MVIASMVVGPTGDPKPRWLELRALARDCAMHLNAATNQLVDEQVADIKLG